MAAALLALLLAQWGALWHAVTHGPLSAAGLLQGAEQQVVAHTLSGVHEQRGDGGSACDHAPHPAHHAEHHAAHHAAQRPAHHAADHSAESDPFGHSAGSPVCQLVDQLLLDAAVDTTGTPPDNASWATEGPHPQRRAATPSAALAAYEARGPPQA